MRPTASALILVVVVITATDLSAASQRFSGFRLHREFSEEEKALAKDILRARKDAERRSGSADGDDGQWFAQRVDHFDGSNNATWKQRFWHFNQASGGPQFLCLGGEGPAEVPDFGAYFACGFMIHEYAKAVNASLWVLEHRFYGYSRPFP